MMAAILGVLMSRNAYVPLDPAYPQERLALMLADSDPSLVLAEPGEAARARELGGGSIPVLEMDVEASRGDSPPLSRAPSAEQPAYILYTSGSTGKPKGVVQLHGNVLHHIQAYASNLGIRAEDRLSLVSSYAFDAAIMDIFGAFLTGASLYPFDVREAGLDALAAWLDHERISIYHSTPTLFRALCGTVSPDRVFPAVRLVVLGGEEVTKGDVELWRRHFGRDCTLINGLGPTESTLALQMSVSHDYVVTGTRVPVGYPVEDTDIVLLDSEGAEATVRGEIGIRSAFLAAEYWRRPDLTTSAFLPDPVDGTRRIYRSGDMAWLRPEGSLEFLGRHDDQVKIRGIRVELAEVEHCLKAHPAVAHCVVTCRRDPAGHQRLVAYVVCRNDADPSPLKSHLARRLPEYMVPTLIVPLSRLPLTPSGKVDRQHLPEPTWPAGTSSGAPSTATEEEVAKTWQEVLGVVRMGRMDNFFDMGGQSLLAMQVISRLRRAFGVEIPLRALFEAPTVASLAAVVARFLQDAQQGEQRASAVGSARRKEIVL
jgi:amino acid adenylation domain-containing protein